MADVTMPQLGETVVEGTILRWAKGVGDHVDQDEVLFEVSTDKVDSEVPSPVSGYLAEIVVPEGETVEVGTRLAVITDTPPGDGATAQREAAEAAAPPPAAAPPAAPPPAAPPEAVPPAARPSTAGAPDSRLLSPVVRRLIAENHLDPAQITGTGEGGRITREDVLAAVDSMRQGGVPAAALSTLSSQAQPVPPVPRTAPEVRPVPKAGERTEVVPFTNIRRRTADHMVRSKATSAHTLTAVEVDFENVERVRRSERERFKATEGASLSFLPFIARATIDALRDYPRLNASVGENSLLIHHDIHLGIAVDLELEGLIVPVIHEADGKRFAALAREIADLANRARSRKLTADDIAGGTFTITNPGPFGTFMTIPIINQPQVAILSTDGVRRRPVVVTTPAGDESIAIHFTGILALSFDHRAVDGAYASAFLSKLRETLETRDWLLEL